MGKIHEIFLANHGNLWHTGSTETELKEVYHVMDHVIKTILPPIIGVLELMGIFVVAWSGLRGFWDYLQNTFRHKITPSNTTWLPVCPRPWHLKWLLKF